MISQDGWQPPAHTVTASGTCSHSLRHTRPQPQVHAIAAPCAAVCWCRSPMCWLSQPRVLVSQPRVLAVAAPCAGCRSPVCWLSAGGGGRRVGRGLRRRRGWSGHRRLLQAGQTDASDGCGCCLWHTGRQAVAHRPAALEGTAAASTARDCNVQHIWLSMVPWLRAASRRLQPYLLTLYSPTHVQATEPRQGVWLPCGRPRHSPQADGAPAPCSHRAAPVPRRCHTGATIPPCAHPHAHTFPVT